MRRARMRAWPSRDWAAGMLTRNVVRNAGIPRTGQASKACRGQDRACPSRYRSVDSECAAPSRRSCQRFYFPSCNPAILQSWNLMIPVIVLAAGKSTRMGRLKANLPLGTGHTFLTRVVATFLAASVDDVVVVVGHEADAVIVEFAKSGLPARFV